MFQLKITSYFSFLLILIFISCQTDTKSNIHLPPIFTNQMVLQQNTEANIWGTATPNTKIEIKASWGKATNIITEENGTWKAAIPTPEAGGPFELTIQASDTIISIRDILIGEVWLCSGQSNMEMPLKGWPPSDPIHNSEEEIANAQYPDIRMFTVKKAYDVVPRETFCGSWEVCNPENAGDFSATAYFFGRTLHKKLNVPIGLIHTSWGGTLAEAWTEGKHLASLEDFKDVLTKLEKAKPQQAALNEWLTSKPTVNNSEVPIEKRFLYG